MKCDQVAMYCANEKGANMCKHWLGLGLADWVTDTVTAEVWVRGQQATNVAELQFCYALGTEFEIIRYVAGPHWWDQQLIMRPFFCHLGFHLDDKEDWPEMRHASLVQEVFKTRHTNPELVASGKTYQYRIHEVSPNTYWKFIRRVLP